MEGDEQANLRRKWVAYWRKVQEAREAGDPNQIPFPPELHDLRCGAKTRAGTPCKMNALFRSGRCKLHGGLSTGPTSVAGKARSAQNGKSHHEPHEDLTKPVIGSLLSGEAAIRLHSLATKETVSRQAVGLAANDAISSATVRCVDCFHMSAAHTCRLNAANGIPMGTQRICLHFDQAAVLWG